VNAPTPGLIDTGRLPGGIKRSRGENLPLGPVGEPAEELLSMIAAPCFARYDQWQPQSQPSFSARAGRTCTPTSPPIWSAARCGPSLHSAPRRVCCTTSGSHVS
jgi:hypothetical protein